MDFFRIAQKKKRSGVIEVYPDFRVCRSEDLMVRGGDFYAIWNEEKSMWSTDEYDVQRLVDKELMDARNKIADETGTKVIAKLLTSYSSRGWSEFKSYVGNISDNSKQLDNEVTFMNDEVKKKSYVSKRVPYSLVDEFPEAWNELVGTLYEPKERAKIEWAIGSIVSGESKSIQKFIVLYGEPGTGKSTILNIIQKLFEGYYTTFEAKELAGSRNTFSTEVFKKNPLVAIQHDGDLSRIENNTKLNSIISHEEMTMHEKYKSSYMAKINSFLFMATNKPVQITDSKSGIIRRLMDVKPSGNTLNENHYYTLMSKIDFELGKIANHCMQTFHEMGKNYYSNYKPLDMIYQTDIFFNFVEMNYHTFKEEDGVSLSRAYKMYKEYVEESMVTYKLARHKFREELMDYFENFKRVARVDGKQIRSYYSGFLYEKFSYRSAEDLDDEIPYSLVLDNKESIFDTYADEYTAQYAKEDGTPKTYWANVDTTLKDLDTNKLHYVMLPENHIVIDFDLTDESGNKDLEKNLEAASKWPSTYSEISKSGSGIHLHYVYEGDTSRLKREYDEHIEVKVYNGKSALRRKLTKCNHTKIATISSGLPMKGEKVINFKAVKNEKALRTLIEKNLKKEYHPGTKPSIDFIHKILEDAYESEIHYDVSDLAGKVLTFANNSTNQAATCVKLVGDMKFKSEEPSLDTGEYEDERMIFFDVEVFKNFFGIVWKYEGDATPVKMYNPTPQEVEPLLNSKLVGFNNRRYDNHILYARYLGYTNEQLYTLSKKIINNDRTATFMEAYSLSYTDIYDFSSKKQSLKKFQIELGIHHQELHLDWDEPVPEDMLDEVMDYCVNDVISTEKVFEARHQDFVARQILAELSGLTVNDKTQRHTAKIIFGDNKKPQKEFVYTDLSEEFPGYEFDYGKSTYKDIQPGEGGYVYATPGMYGNVALLDVASMHPNSAIIMNVFGKYTKNYKDLLDARIAIKKGNYEKAKGILGEAASKYLEDEETAKALSYALKIIINIVYGLTSAKYDNIFRDPRNVDNIVAKRGALFMIDLQLAVQKEGYEVVHIKTDSIKIADADDYIIDFVTKMGKEYGYDFEHEATYDKLALVNKAVYVAKYKEKDGEPYDGWETVGKQFSEPYVFKQLFTGEDIVFKDFCQTKNTRSALYLDMNEDLDDVSDLEDDAKKLKKKLEKDISDVERKEIEDRLEEITPIIEKGHAYEFIGKTGSFVPIKPGKGGGVLLRYKDGKYYAVTGTKGYRWLESELVEELGKEADVNEEYFKIMLDEAIKALAEYGFVEWFVSDERYDAEDNGIIPF